MKRKIVQIAATATPNEPDQIYALCTDGTVWQLIDVRRNPQWTALPPIPQDNPNQTNAATEIPGMALTVQRAQQP